MEDREVIRPLLDAVEEHDFDPTHSNVPAAGVASVESGPSDGIVAKSNDVNVATASTSVSRQMPAYVASLTPEERRKAEKALVRKIDMRLILSVVIMYILNYIDRNAVASARLGYLEEDLHLQGSQYQTAVSVLFIGYISMQIPSNLLMNKLGRPSRYLPIAMMVWGVISACTGITQSYIALLIVRFTLGFVESVFFPGALFLLSCFYTRKEMSLRTALLYSGSLVSGTISGLLSAAIIEMDGILGLRAWRWLFIVEGVTTILVAFVCRYVLPDMPRTTTWLTREQRELAAWRLNEDIGQEDEEMRFKEDSFIHGLTLAVTDVKVWIMTVLLFCMVFSGSVTNFFPTVVETLGFGPVHSLLLTAPPYLLGVITCCLNAWHSDRTGERCLHITLPLLVAMFSFMLAAFTSAIVPRYVAMMLMIPGCFTGYVVALGWISAIIPRPPAKRAAAIALTNAVSNASSILSAYMYPRSAAPGYKVAFTLCFLSSMIAVLTVVVLRVVLVRLNKRLDRSEFAQDVAASGSGIPEQVTRRGFRFLL